MKTSVNSKKGQERQRADLRLDTMRRVEKRMHSIQTLAGTNGTTVGPTRAPTFVRDSTSGIAPGRTLPAVNAQVRLEAIRFEVIRAWSLMDVAWLITARGWTLTLNQPLHAEGKIGFRRGVSDSTTLIGFFHSTGSMRSNDSQNSATPENFVGAAIEGPSAEGFYFYPTYGVDQEGVRADGGRGTPTPPYIYPDGASRDWTLDYDPGGNGGTGSITVTLDGQAVTLNLDQGHKQVGAQFNRFGMITTHIDGSGQSVYFDDLTYAIGVAPPSLTVKKRGPAEILLQWPASYSGFFVESTFSLHALVQWQPIASVAVIEDGVFNVAVTPAGEAQFFRLRKP